MKNNYGKNLVAFCVATLIFLGIQSSDVMAYNDNNLALFEDKVEENPDKLVNEDILKKDNIALFTTSAEEKELLARLVEAEAKGETYEGKVAIATVVLNRVESTEFPNTVTEVVFEKVGNAYAFSPVQNGEINKSASNESKQAVEKALKRTDRLKNAIYFYNPEIATDNWIRTREIVKTIDNHVFAI